MGIFCLATICIALRERIQLFRFAVVFRSFASRRKPLLHSAPRTTTKSTFSKITRSRETVCAASTSGFHVLCDCVQRARATLVYSNIFRSDMNMRVREIRPMYVSVDRLMRESTNALTIPFDFYLFV